MSFGPQSDTTGSGVRVSLILCHNNAADRLPWTLGHLKRLVPGVSWELIAVDNASTDPRGHELLAAFAKDIEAPVLLLKEPNPGKQWAFRTGALAARGEFLVMVDDDNGLTRRYLERMVAIFEAKPQAAMVGGRGELVTEAVVPDWFEAVQFRWAVGPQGQRATAGPLLYIWGAGVGMRTKWVRQILDSNFPFLMSGPTENNRLVGGEDVEWGFIFQALGKLCWYDPSLVFRHNIPGSKLTIEHAEALKNARKPATARVSACYRPILELQQSSFRDKMKMILDILRNRSPYRAMPWVMLQWMLGPWICVEPRVSKLRKLTLQ